MTSEAQGENKWIWYQTALVSYKDIKYEALINVVVTN